MSNIRHSSGQPKWGTSPEVIAIARAVLHVVHRDHPWPIDVDPFSEPEFNRHVGASRILTGEKGFDGFKDRWCSSELSPRADYILAGLPLHNRPDDVVAETALVNPPGDELGDNTKKAWVLLDAYHRLGWIDSALWVGFNLNQLQTLQRESARCPLCDDFRGWRCVPDHRLKFIAHSTREAKDDAPSHPSFFVLLPSHNPILAAEQYRLFDSMASELGETF